MPCVWNSESEPGFFGPLLGIVDLIALVLSSPILPPAVHPIAPNKNQARLDQCLFGAAAGRCMGGYSSLVLLDFLGALQASQWEF